MVDRITPARRSKNMAAIKSKGMKPELIVRKAAHRLGYRFRLHRNDLPGKPDLVFPKYKIVIFVHGCFWHQHQDKNCKIARMPKSRLDYWEPKLNKNVSRDRQHLKDLDELGWKSFVIWECQTKDPSLLRELIDGIFP